MDPRAFVGAVALGLLAPPLAGEGQQTGKVPRVGFLTPISQPAREDVFRIVTATGTAAVAAKKATQTIPIVMIGSGDAVRQGLVASLARPGGNVTGLTMISPELSRKRLELLREMRLEGYPTRPRHDRPRPQREPVEPSREDKREGSGLVVRCGWWAR
jgi:hypothetical protein